MTTRTYNPDKAFLRRVCKKAASKKEAASLCGFSESTLTRRLKEFGLDKELKILTEKGIKARTDSSHRKKVAVKKKASKPKRILPKSTLDSLSEEAALDQEIRQAEVERRVVHSSEEDQNEFFSSLASKLGQLEGKTTLNTIEAPKELSDTSKRDKYLPVLLKIANILIEECE